MKRPLQWFAIFSACILAGSLPATELGDPAPPLSIAHWIKGKAVDLKEGQGKNIYVVEFWATWCGPCLTSIPQLTQMQKQFKDKNVVFIGVSDEEVKTVKSFVGKMGDKMDYVVAIDSGKKTADAYKGAFGVRDIPHAFIVDRTGNLVWHGPPTAGLDNAIEEILEGKYDLTGAKRTARIWKMQTDYFTIVSTGLKNTRAAELGNQIIADAAKSPITLNQFAWRILTDRQVRTRDLELALKAAQAAHAEDGGKDATILDTYARALFETGKKAEAIQYQTKAIAVCQDKALKPELEARLNRYQRLSKGP